MKILVTGVLGRLGREIVDVLRTKHELVLTDCGPRSNSYPGIRYGALHDRFFCYALLEGVDAVVHVANDPSPWPADELSQLHDNLMSNLNLFWACARLGVRRVIFASSIMTTANRSVAEGADSIALPYLPLDGKIRRSADGVYSLGKSLSEEALELICREGSLGAFSIRYPLLIQPDYRVTRKFERTGELTLNEIRGGAQFLTYSDAARLVDCVIDRGAFSGHEVIFPGSRENMTGMSNVEIIQKYYSKVSLRQPIETLEGLTDLRGLRDKYGWEPSR